MGNLFANEPDESFDLGIIFWWFDNSILTSIESFVAPCLMLFIESDLVINEKYI